MRRHRPRNSNQQTNDELDDDINSIEFEMNENEFDNEKRCLLKNHSQKQIVTYQNIDNFNEPPLKNLTLKDLVKFATEVARGMEFLASKKVLFIINLNILK